MRWRDRRDMPVGVRARRSTPRPAARRPRRSTASRRPPPVGVGRQRARDQRRPSRRAPLRVASSNHASNGGASARRALAPHAVMPAALPCTRKATGERTSIKGRREAHAQAPDAAAIDIAMALLARISRLMPRRRRRSPILQHAATAEHACAATTGGWLLRMSGRTR